MLVSCVSLVLILQTEGTLRNCLQIQQWLCQIKTFFFFGNYFPEPGTRYLPIANKSYQPFRQLFRPSRPFYFTLTTKHSVYISVITRTYVPILYTYMQSVGDTRPVNRIRFCHLTLDVTVSSFNAVVWIRIRSFLARSNPDTDLSFVTRKPKNS